MFSNKRNESGPSSSEHAAPVTTLPATVSSTPTPTSRVVHPVQKPLIGANVRINGDVSFDGDLIIEGVVKGDVTSTDQNAHLVVQPGASIDGNVKIANVQHNGTIRGSVESNGLLTISTTGSVVGPVKYNRLVLEMGAVVNGSLEQVHVDAPQMVAQPEAQYVDGRAGDPSDE